jgi:hypothetical protein
MLRERAEVVGADFRLTSAANQSTEIVVTWFAPN